MNDDAMYRIADALERIAKALEGGATKAASPAPQRSAAPASGSRSGATLPNYGRNKGGLIADASIDDLYWYGERCAQSISDPSKARFRDQESARLADINAELKRRGQSPVGESGNAPVPADDWRGAPPTNQGPPGGSFDEDIPF